MELIHIIILAVVQGLTEFLPISSSAHLILFPRLLGWPDQGLAFDVAVHVGTLSAVVLYMRRELVPLARDWTLSLARRETTGDSRLAWGVLIGTLPAGIAGILFNDLVGTDLRSPLVIAATTIVFGLLLWWADVQGRRWRREQQLRWRDFILIGIAQALAIIPGTSRSGVTITAGLLLGMTRPAAARFSFLLSIPIILAAGGLKTAELVQQQAPVDGTALLLGVLLSGITAYACIHVFLKLLERMSLWPFIAYRLVLGLFLLAVFL